MKFNSFRFYPSAVLLTRSFIDARICAQAIHCHSKGVVPPHRSVQGRLGPAGQWVIGIYRDISNDNMITMIPPLLVLSSIRASVILTVAALVLQQSYTRARAHTHTHTHTQKHTHTVSKLSPPTLSDGFPKPQVTE